jgi:hypothetical protein
MEVIHDTYRFKHKGAFQGIAPAGKEASITGTDIYRIVDSKIVEQWIEDDMLSLIQQLGIPVIPGPRLLVRMLVRQAKKLRSRLPAGR